jgi:hypothetical protein
LRYSRLILTAVVCSLMPLMASQASATPIASGITYQVLDHPDGQLAPPVYALRLDGLDGDNSHEFTFSAETNGAFLRIRYEAADNTITFAGQVYGGRVNNNAYIAPQLWDVSFVYGGVNDFGGHLDATPGQGSGTITAVGNNNVIQLVDKANSDGLSFRVNYGHRTENDVATGYGWLTHDQSKRSPSQDWLFTIGDPVPEPGTATLLGVGLAGLASGRRLRKRPSGRSSDDPSGPVRSSGHQYP